MPSAASAALMSSLIAAPTAFACGSSHTTSRLAPATAALRKKAAAAALGSAQRRELVAPPLLCATGRGSMAANGTAGEEAIFKLFDEPPITLLSECRRILVMPSLSMTLGLCILTVIRKRRLIR